MSRLSLPVLARNTEVLSTDSRKIGRFIFQNSDESFLGDWDFRLAPDSPDAVNLSRAAQNLRTSDVPVAFPTETVYGLGADATRPGAVRGIFEAKQRPSDNPLIVHISSLRQLRDIFNASTSAEDCIPAIYIPLIQNFWPGPLTIILPLPTPSPFAAEVTANLNTVGVRMPLSPLALALIHLVGKPLAAPSANGSSRPSPTTADHVLHDLSGRIEMILDGGSCNVGLESTVVDGLCNPPLILRPGAVSIEMIKGFAGWKDVRQGYRDGVEESTPRAPGMKYKHYSPKAKVILVRGEMNVKSVQRFVSSDQNLGIIRTKKWPDPATLFGEMHIGPQDAGSTSVEFVDRIYVGLPEKSQTSLEARESSVLLSSQCENKTAKVWSVALGSDSIIIARLLFSALRQLDCKGVDVIFVEAIDESTGESAGAVMNRLRKAAEIEIETQT